jgi:hypothetical protein
MKSTVMTILIVGVLLGLTSSCAKTSKTQLDGLLNKPISEAAIAFGKAPNSSMQLDDGTKVYTWRWPLSGTGPGVTGRLMYEVVTLWVDSSGKIIRYQRQTE